MDQEQLDLDMMRRCLQLARKAEGRTSPNPMVGALVLDVHGEIVGEGFHPKAGQPHAEVFAFDQAAERSYGGTLYVNLEPCSHFGRTPPCADRVVASKVKRVVIGMEDPNPKVSGAGIKKLRDAGIEVEVSALESECRILNRAFVKRITKGLPWLTLKMATSLDGRIADRHGKSRWISGPEARKFVQLLRNVSDCVLVGGTTALLDDPELNVREIEDGRDPHRAVISRSLKVPPTARLCQHKPGAESWTALFFERDELKTKIEYAQQVKLIDLAKLNDDESSLRKALRWLANNGVQSVLCEGGGRLAAALLEEQLVDEVCWISAPKFFVDAQAASSLAGSEEMHVGNCSELVDPIYTQLGSDMLVRGTLSYEKKL